MLWRKGAGGRKNEIKRPIDVLRDDDGTVVVRLGSGWEDRDPARCLRNAASILYAARPGDPVVFEDAGLDRQDTIVVSMVMDLVRAAQDRNLDVKMDTLPDSMSKLVNLALAVPHHETPGKIKEPYLIHLGKEAVAAAHASREFIEFLGELIYSLFRLLFGKARFRRRDFWVTLQDCGSSALPIVSLLSILTGMILGFVGAMQLRKFGATIYMTDLVGLAMAREMGCLMTGIIMSGRTGAAFAAQIGSMNGKQEVDAPETLGISPIEFLVLPRTVALVLMMPLLTMYADILGWLGAFFVALPMGINPAEFWIQLKESLDMGHVHFGLFKSLFFGIVVATAGCYYGLKSGRSSAAVGTATTKAVVSGITWIVVVDALFAVLFEVL